MNKQQRNWKTVSSKTVYENKWIKVIEDQVIQPNGNNGIYAYMVKSNGNFIIPMDSDKNVYLIEEYRYPIKNSIIQLVAGSHDGQDELESAEKELFEEIGIKAKSWLRLGAFYQAPGHETIFDPIYLATDLDVSGLKTSSQEDDESILRVIKVSIPTLKQMILNNEIECAMSVAGLNLFFLWLDSNTI